MTVQPESTLDEDSSVSTSWFNWRPTSVAKLIQAEYRMLHHLWEKIEGKFVAICNGTKRIWTIVMNEKADPEATPIVMLHGMGAGVGMWVFNLETISAKNPLYAMDVLGFGRSSRPKFSRDSSIAELEFVESIEEWRREMKLDKFVLLGHSLGGFIAASYAMRYPDRLEHLVLVDPWGLPEPEAQTRRKTPIPLWRKIIFTLLSPLIKHVNPLGVVRLAGPWGPSLIQRFRRDLLAKFSSIHDNETITQYIYHCNAQQPSGEIAFKSMTQNIIFAKYPIVSRINDIHQNVGMTLIFGSKSWVDSGPGYAIKSLRSGSYVDVQVIPGGTHHVYADRAEDFNSAVVKICGMVDNNAKSKREQSGKQNSETRERDDSFARHEGDLKDSRFASSQITPVVEAAV